MMLLKHIIHLNLLHLCFGYNILLMFPFPYKSHEILGKGIIRNLVEAGHKVTYVSTFSIKNSFPTVRNIVLNTTTVFDNTWNLDACMYNGKYFIDINYALPAMIKHAKDTLTDEAFVEFINDKSNRYDLVVIEWMYVEVYSGLSAVFDCPYVWFFSYEQDLNILNLIHELPSTSHSTNLRTLNTPPLDIVQRMQEIWYQVKMTFMKKFYFYPKEVEIYNKIFEPIMRRNNKTLPNYGDIRLNASLALSNTHISFRDMNIIPMTHKAIGGFHIDEQNQNPFDQDIQELMDKSVNGVILFTMGSTLDFKDLPPHLTFDLMKMLGSLNQTVLWKSSKILENIPVNVKMSAWLPQQKILGHKNCVLFITHGGVSSFTESVHYAVPIIGIPAFADQFMNIKMAEKNGFGRKVDLSLDMVDHLREVIREVLSSPQYKIAAKKRSTIYHDRMVPPGKELVFWIEHVVKTQGAPHLRSPALLVPWYQRYHVDIIIICMLLIIALVYVMYKLLLLKIIFKTKKIKDN